jgi:hypothetical protein
MMLSDCCANALQHGMALGSQRIGCGDCGTKWSRATDSPTWVDDSERTVEFSVDERAVAVSVNPEQCCIQGIAESKRDRLVSFYCECGISWRRSDPESDTWACYSQRAS